MNLSIILAFGAMFGWGVADFLIQKTVKKIGSLETLAWITILGAIILVPLILSEGINLNRTNIIFLIFLGAVTFVAGLLDFKALKIGKLAVIETIMAIELPLTILLGVLAFQERLNFLQVILVSLVFIGIVLASVNFKNLHHRDFLEKGSLLAIASGLTIAFVNFFSADQAKSLSPLMAIWFPWLSCGMICLIYISRFKKSHFKNFVKQSLGHWRLILIVALIDLGAWLLYAFAVAKEELSITIAITESYIVVAIILSVLINREKIRPVQYLGSTLAIIGSLLIGFIS